VSIGIYITFRHGVSLLKAKYEALVSFVN
jgi:hypothetical protein